MKKMPRSRLWMREEMRMLGAIQIVTGLILNNLGLMWMYLLLTKVSAFGTSYIPVAALTGYPFWSSLSFILSGAFAVVVEKRNSKSLMSYTIGMNFLSACVASSGIVLLIYELAAFVILSEDSLWPQKSGALLSTYLFIFTALELFVAIKVTEWAYKQNVEDKDAVRGRRRSFAYILKNHLDLSQAGKFSGQQRASVCSRGFLENVV